MRTEGQAHLLRIFVNESDRWEGRAVYESIVRAAREAGLAGATALRAIEGFGATGRVHSVKVLHLSADVPIVVEIIDSPERIADFLPTLDNLIGEGVATIEKVHALTYRRDNAETAPPDSDDEIQLDTGEPTPPVELQPVFNEEASPIQQILGAAQEQTARSRRVYVDSADVLLAMLCESDGIARKALTSLGIECRTVERAVRDQVNRDEPSAGYSK